MHFADIIGIGQTKPAEHWGRELLDLAVEAAGDALDEASCRPTAVIVGNALNGCLGDQRNLAAYVAARLGLAPAECTTVEVDEASGGAALRTGLSLIKADLHEKVLVIAAEKATDAMPDALEAGRAAGLDVLREAGFGFGLPIAAALAMQQYIEKYKVERADFYHVSALAHSHAARNRNAFFSWPLSYDQYIRSPLVADPVTVCDTAPPCDGAAAVVLRRVNGDGKKYIRISGSASVSHRPGISDVALNLELPAARASAHAAMSQAKLNLDEISLFELHDSSSIMAVLSLEALGLARRGEALKLASQNAFSIDGPHPVWTFGGLKARGHSIGASGLYQVVEAVLQLRREAGGNQVRNAQHALVQCLGSFGATAITHVLSC